MSDHYKMPYWDGMSLRDWFAGQALGAVIRNAVELRNDHSGLQSYSADELAAYAYKAADAMLEVRK